MLFAYAVFRVGGSSRRDFGSQIAVGPEAFTTIDGGLAAATSLICAGCAAPNGSSLVTPLGKDWIALWKFVHAFEAGSEVSLA